MPTYGESKRRDMIRSVLPSTSRKSSRDDKAHVNRQHRRMVNREIRNFEDTSFDLNRDSSRKMREVVWERRNRDKVAPLVRWARRASIKAGIPREERQDYFRSLLPNDLIGRHARSHLAVIWEPYWDDDGRWLGVAYREREAKVRADSRQELERKLRWVVEQGLVSGLNDAVKRSHRSASYSNTRWAKETADGESKWIHEWCYGHRMWVPKTTPVVGYSQIKSGYMEVPCRCRPRCLLGVHDISAFIDRLGSQPRHPEWRKAVDEFLEQFA